MREVKIEGEYIKLGQLLKFVSIIDNGSYAKFFLQENEVLVNGEKEDRRGRKIYKGDVVEVLKETFIIK